MERAKSLLQAHYSVRQAGIEVGMHDPYHFSKQFKNIVGMSPSVYMRQATRLEKKWRINLTALLRDFEDGRAVFFFLSKTEKKGWTNAHTFGIISNAGFANIAQLVEQRFRKPQVKGSSPFIGSSFFEV